MRRSLAAVCLILFISFLPWRPSLAQQVPAYVAADPKAPVVTPANLLASDRFWPYQLELVKEWTPPGRSQPLPTGTVGVLIRIDTPELARVDFGRDGRFAVPIGALDLLVRANRIRVGELPKVAPNLVHSIASRLLDPDQPAARTFDFAAIFEPPGFLGVFADPGADGFVELTRALLQVRGRNGVMTVLFPQGQPADGKTREKLRELGWTVPFVMGQLSEGYSQGLLPPALDPPAVMLLTPEGRVVFQSPWKESAVADLKAAIDRSFPPAVPTAAALRDAQAR